MLIGALHKILIYSWNQSVFFLSRQGVFQWTMLLFPESSPPLYSALILLNCLLVLHTQGFFIKRRLYSGFLIWSKCFLFNLIEVFSLTKFFLSLFNTESNIKAMPADKNDLDIYIYLSIPLHLLGLKRVSSGHFPDEEKRQENYFNSLFVDGNRLYDIINIKL